jgi:hypothetical protein
MAAPRPRRLVCDASVLAPDAETIEALARFKLDALRGGQDAVLRGPSSELLALLDLCGLRDVLRVEVGGQAEQREEPVGIQEERELADPGP